MRSMVGGQVVPGRVVCCNIRPTNHSERAPPHPHWQCYMGPGMVEPLHCLALRQPGGGLVPAIKDKLAPNTDAPNPQPGVYRGPLGLLPVH